MIDITDRAVEAALRVWNSGDGHETNESLMRAAIAEAVPYIADEPTEQQAAEDRAQWLATLKAQQTAAEFAGELAAAQADALARIEALIGRLAPQDDGSGKYNSVWSMALALAVQRENTLGEQQSNRDLLDDAGWFYDLLMAGPPKQPVPDCQHCGADSSMSHADDCPFNTYPGHDMSVTIGACRPYRPCPACSQRIAAEGGREAGLEDRALDESRRCPKCQMVDGHDPWCPTPRNGETFPGVHPDGTGTGEFSGRAGG